MHPLATGGRAWRAIALISFLGLFASELFALERLQRKLDLERGLPFSEVNSIAQDTRGFIWITAGGALFRYDGRDLRPWAKQTLNRYIKTVTTGPAAEVLVRAGPFDAGVLYEVAGEELQAVSGPGATPLSIRGLPVWDARGGFWVITENREVWFRLHNGAWNELAPSRIDSEIPTILQTAAHGTVILVTTTAIWSVDQEGSATRLALISGVQRVLASADESLVVFHVPPGGGGRVLEFRNDQERQLFYLAARPIDMVQLGQVLWIAYDTAVVALKPDQPPELLGPDQQVPSGGPLLVDQEGSLWIASYRGLLQYPAPESVAWGVSDGMASNGARRVVLTHEGVWVDSWGGLTLLRSEESRWYPERVLSTTTSPICASADGSTWSAARDRILEFRDGRRVEHPLRGLVAADSCATGAEGRVWLATNLGLVLARSDRSPSAPRLRAGPPGVARSGVWMSVLEDSNARLWVAAEEAICHTDGDAGSTVNLASWSCSSAEGAGRITSLVEVSPGTIWAGTLQAGVLRQLSSGRWEPIRGSHELPTPCVRMLRPSPAGGTWIVSFGTILRVVEQLDSENGWAIVERPSPWHGLMISDAEDLVEAPNGDLWITTLAGLVHIPNGVRRAVPAVPRVELVAALADGSPLASNERVSLPFHRNRIELRFAALSFRDPTLLRYQVRLRPDAPWLDSIRPSFQFVDLPPGNYHASLRASLDGQHWTSRPAEFSFSVRPPFWRTWWFAASVVLLVAGSAAVVYRARLRQAVELERTRTRIAMDLHDDVGSSLSQIALQSELVLSRLERGQVDAGAALEQIATNARGVVDAMSDVVWSIDPRHDVLSDLVRRIRATAMEAQDSSGVEVRLELPDLAHDVRLSALARRQAYLVFKEALNNALRHAGATRIDVTLSYSAREVELGVADDGVGFEASAPGENPAAAPIARGGHGLENMRRRAAACGGSLRIERRADGGTITRLKIPLA